MLQLNIKTAKKFFFYDQQGHARIMQGLSKARRKNLTVVGALVRTVARRSMRKPRRMKVAEFEAAIPQQDHWRYDPDKAKWPLKRPFVPSEPGQPPRVRTGLLKKFLYFVYDERTKSVVIGPAKLDNVSAPDVPSILEFGGNSEGFEIKPRAYMRPALEVVRTRHQAEYMRVWKDSIV